MGVLPRVVDLEAGTFPVGQPGLIAPSTPRPGPGTAAPGLGRGLLPGHGSGRLLRGAGAGQTNGNVKGPAASLRDEEMAGRVPRSAGRAMDALRNKSQRSRFRQARPAEVPPPWCRGSIPLWDQGCGSRCQRGLWEVSRPSWGQSGAPWGGDAGPPVLRAARELHGCRDAAQVRSGFLLLPKKSQKLSGMSGACFSCHSLGGTGLNGKSLRSYTPYAAFLWCAHLVHPYQEGPAFPTKLYYNVDVSVFTVCK